MIQNSWERVQEENEVLHHFHDPILDGFGIGVEVNSSLRIEHDTGRKHC
jgi:hypothetical protein